MPERGARGARRRPLSIARSRAISDQQPVGVSAHEHPRIGHRSPGTTRMRLTRQSRARQARKARRRIRAQARCRIASLGRIDPPPPPASAWSRYLDAAGSHRHDPARRRLPEIPLDRRQRRRCTARLRRKTAEQLAGASILRRGVLDATPGPARAAWLERSQTAASASRSAGRLQVPSELAALLHPDADAGRARPSAADAAPAAAQRGIHRLHAGDRDRSTLPGMTTCVMATDTFGVDGRWCCWSAAPS